MFPIHVFIVYLFGSQFLFTLPRLLSPMGIMASSSLSSDPVATWYGGNRQARPPRSSSFPALSMYRSVLILINYLPAIDDIQRYHRSRVIDNALQEPVYGNPWIIRPAIFIIGETIRSSSLLHTTFESLHETLVYQIQVRWQINIPDDFFTLRFTDSHGESHDIPRDAHIFWTLEFYRPDWNRVQHAEDNSRIPFVAGLSQPYILRLTAHRSA